MLKHNLTEEEIEALPFDYNLADGHAYRGWCEDERDIIDSLPELCASADRRDQCLLERQYLESFFRLARQTLPEAQQHFFFCFTASTALEVVANYLRLANKSVALIEPCFDNLADILKRHGVRMVALPDTVMGYPLDRFQDSIRQLETDAIFLVTPNNPTGECVTEENFSWLADFCRTQGKLLIIDACFRFYLPDDLCYDQYKILTTSGVDFIIVEDTGKTWPTLELKAPFFCVSDSLSQPIRAIYTDFLLHVSPVVLKLMKRFLDLSIATHRQTILRVVQRNRAALYNAARTTFLEPVEKPFSSVSWLRIRKETCALNVVDDLKNAGVHLLPGHQFFWSAKEHGSRFLRIALVRDEGVFRHALPIIKAVCNKDER